VDGLASEGIEDLVDLVVGGLGLNASEQGLEVVGVYVVERVLMSFLPERARRA
jgi:hypothetical protein